jgi:CBS domain-containing protein
MARYHDDYRRDRMGLRDFEREERGRGAGYGRFGRSRGQWSGGMRSDAGVSRWERFPGEEGWLGGGYAGYAGGDVRATTRGYGREYRGGYGEDIRGGRWSEGDWGGSERGLGAEYRGGYGWRGGAADDDDGWQERGGSDADRVRARDIMTDDPEIVTPEATVADVAKKMRELDVGIIPVVDSPENRRLRGVITDRDLAIRVLAAGKDGKARVGEYMTEQVETVNQNDSVRDVLAVMKREQVRRVPVTDREGRLVGVIAQADLAVSYAGLDLQRETEVEEAIERISEPARPRR